MIRINSGYIGHKDAENSLREMLGIELNVIDTDSPYELAKYKNPNIVISHNSKLINGEFPTIKFCGPDCTFPNIPFEYEVGVDTLPIFTSTSIFPIKSEWIFLNRTSNNELIQKALSLNRYIRVFGPKINYYGYTGPIDNPYKYMGACTSCIVDTEADALRAIAMNIKQVYTPFPYPFCTNIMGEQYSGPIVDRTEFIESKLWVTIFKKVLE